MTPTKIQYADVVWNPITGCTNDMPCREYCWARRFAARLAGRAGYPATDPFKPTFHPERLEEPLRRKKPAIIPVCFMGDMFCSESSGHWVCQVFDAMLEAPQHRYLLLTKRPGAMAMFVKWFLSPALLPTVLDHIWFGTSVSCNEDMRCVDKLRECRVSHRWLSIEPLAEKLPYLDLDGIGWVVVGGGPFPVQPDWVRSIRDQCVTAGVPFWFKQWSNRKADGCLLDGREWHELPEGLKCKQSPLF